MTRVGKENIAVQMAKQVPVARCTGLQADLANLVAALHLQPFLHDLICHMLILLALHLEETRQFHCQVQITRQLQLSLHKSHHAIHASQ